MPTTRTFDPLAHALSSIAQFDDDESKKLQDETGISSLDDLAYLTFDDLKDVLPNATLLKLRKLESVIQFVTDGHTFDDTCTAKSIRTQLVQAARVLPPSTPIHSSSSGSSGSTIKTPLNCIPKFTGDPIEFEQWDIDTRATLGQTPHSFLMNRTPVASGPSAASEQTKNTEFYHMLVHSCSAGNSYHLISAIPNENGYNAWQAIQKYYNSEASVAMIVQHYQSRLRKISLNEDTTATEFINEFHLCCQNLDKHKEGYSEKSKTRLFLDLIESDEYEIVKTFIETQISTVTFDTVVKTIRAHELSLSRSSDKKATISATSRRAGKDSKEKNSDSSSSFRFLSDDEISEAQHSSTENEEDDGVDTSNIQPQAEDATTSTQSCGRRGIARRGRHAATTIVFDTGCETPVIGGGA